MLKNNRLYIVLISIWLILAVIFGIYDLEISKRIVNQNSTWANFLEDYGMIPGLLVILSGIFIYYSYIKHKQGFWPWTVKLIFLLITSGIIFYLFDIFLSNNIQIDFVYDHKLIFFTISFIISIAVFALLHLSKPIQDTIKIKYSRIVIGIAFWGYVICIQSVKYFWGRVRFRELNESFTQFTSWYLPQGITGFDSFPSGHSAMGFMLLPMLVLFSKKSWQKNLLFVIILIWGVVLALSRVIVGAHYASDVLFGSFFIIITFLFFYKKFSEEAGN